MFKWNFAYICYWKILAYVIGVFALAMPASVVLASGSHPNIEISIPERRILSFDCSDNSKVAITYKFPLQTVLFDKKSSVDIRKTLVDGNVIQFSMLGHPLPDQIKQISCDIITTSNNIQEVVREKTSIVLDVEMQKAKDSIPKFECIAEEGVYVTVTFIYETQLTYIVRSAKADRSGLSINLPTILSAEEAIEIGCNEQIMLRYFPNFDSWGKKLAPPQRLPSRRDLMPMLKALDSEESAKPLSKETIKEDMDSAPDAEEDTPKYYQTDSSNMNVIDMEFYVYG